MKFNLGTELIQQNAISAILELPLDWSHEVVIRKAKSKRHDMQNRLMWAWFTLLQDETEHGYIKENWHEFFKVKFIKPEMEMIYMYGIETPSGAVTTTDKGVKEFAKYLEKIDFWVVTELGYTFPSNISDDQGAINYKYAITGKQ
jgi:hypothetical protein